MLEISLETLNELSIELGTEFSVQKLKSGKYGLVAVWRRSCFGSNDNQKQQSQIIQVYDYPSDAIADILMLARVTEINLDATTII